MILHGGYTEMTPTGLVERQAGDVYEKQADDLHYISAVLPDTWTLIFTGPSIRDWGFLSDGQWISHSDFTERRIKLITRNGYSGD